MFVDDPNDETKGEGGVTHWY